MKRDGEDGEVGEVGGSVFELYLSRLLAAHRPIEVAGSLVAHDSQPDTEAEPDVEPVAEPHPEASAEPAETGIVPGAEAGYEPDTVVVGADLSDGALIDRLKDQAVQVAALQAAQFATAAEFARRRTAAHEGVEPGPGWAEGALSEFAADEVAAALTLTRWSADRLLEDATRLTSTLPRTLDALAQGRTDLVRARMVCRATTGLSEDAASAVDEAVADRLPTSTTTQLKDVLAAEVIAVDPARAEKRTAEATADRAVTCWPVDDGSAGAVGMAELRAVGPGPQVLDLMDALTALATRPTPSCPTGRGIDAGPDGQPRGVDARRFDALVDLAGSAASGLPGASGRKPAVNVTVALTTLLGVDEHPGYLDGYGPVTAGVARQIAKKGTLRRLLTDPVTGVVVGVDSHTHPWDDTLDPPDNDPPPPTTTRRTTQTHRTRGPDDGGPRGDEDGPPGDCGGGGPPGGSGGRPPDDQRGGRPPEDRPPRNSDVGGGASECDGEAGGRAERASGTAPASRVEPTQSDPPATRTVPLRGAQDGCPVRAAGGGLYRPGRALDRLVRARDARCAAPGCRRRAEACDVDHIVRHPDGPTCACNMQPLCRHHHRMKHQTAWTVERRHDGSRTWIAPTGHCYHLAPAAALPRSRTRRSAVRDRGQADEPVYVSRFDSAAPGVIALRHAVHTPVEDVPPPPSADSTVDAHDAGSPPF